MSDVIKEDLNELKEDLEWQLTFEEIDWNYFKDTVERAELADEKWQSIKKKEATHRVSGYSE